MGLKIDCTIYHLSAVDLCFFTFLLPARKSLQELRQLYFRMKEEVFSSPRAGFAFNTRALERILQEELGSEIRMGDVKRPK